MGNPASSALVPEKSSEAKSAVISVRDVTVAYRSYKQRPTSLKESALRFLRTGVLKHYDTFHALQGVSFEIERGKVFGIIGSNGSGKSTLLKVLSGVLVPTEGEVKVDGTMTSLIELGAGFDPELSAVENIFLNGSLHRKTKAEIESRVEHILEFANLKEFASTPIKYYSSGMYARLGFSVAVDINPDILVVDEILAVGDERFQRKCKEVFSRFLESGKTVVMVSHDLSMLQSFADTVAVLSRGQLQYLGDPKTAVEMYRDASYQAALEVPSQKNDSAHAAIIAAPVVKQVVVPKRRSVPHEKSILCFVNHLPPELGIVNSRSQSQGISVRKAHVESALAQLRKLGNVDIKVCGFRGSSLIPVDVDCSYLEDRSNFTFESLKRMSEYVGKYDYYINVEDDIFIPEDTLSAVIEFDKSALLNECLHPNRVEIREDVAHCVDLEALPGWTTQRKMFEGTEFKVALNPHSGVLILSDAKLRYALSQIDLNFRGRVLSSSIVSAFAYFHSPFSLFRAVDDVAFHSVIHLDHWVPQVPTPPSA
jgi:ABC-type polysaccharide/polyol phosphate transport system ATPase subunit